MLFKRAVQGLLEMMHCHTAEWVAEFFDDVQPLVPGLKGPQGIGCLPLGELAAGMRTPTHLSPRPASCSSARMSPRSSFHNRDFGCSNPGQAASPSFVRASIRGTRWDGRRLLDQLQVSQHSLLVVHVVEHLG